MTPLNAKCPCGSGKKYKRCCINNPNAPWRNKHLKKETRIASKLSICNAYSSVEVLKILALLQLQPQNHGKNIRLEFAVSEVINSFKTKNDILNLNKLRQDLLNEIPKNFNEDPPDNFFTENIIFSTGNNIVYPGIFIDVVEILQHHINSLVPSGVFPEAFQSECRNALTLLLVIQTQIAKALGHTHRMFETAVDDTLFIPANDYILNYKEIFSFDFLQIKTICDKYDIPYNTLDDFVFNWQTNLIEAEDINDNPLFQKPFIFYEGSFLLVMPTAIIQSLIEFILERSKAHHLTTKLTKQFGNSVQTELFPTFGRMQWKSFDVELPSIPEVPDYMFFKESIFKIDYGKVAYVVILTESILDQKEKYKCQKEFSNFLDNRINVITNKLNNVGDVKEIMMVAIISKIGLLSDSLLGLRKASNINYFISLTPIELLVMSRVWKVDKLTLWKYVKYLSFAQQSIQFTPFTSHLAIFDFYKDHSESFFHSDKEKYTHLFLDFRIAGEVRRKGLSKLDRIGIGYGTRENFGFMQCIRKEEFYPVYISEEIYFGIIRSCLMKYSCPIWFEASDNDRKGDLYINAIMYWLNEIYDDAKDYLNQLGKPPIRIELKLHEQFYTIEDTESIEIYDGIDSEIPYKIDPIKRQIFFTIPIEMIQFFSGPDNKGERILIDFLLDMFGKLMVATGGRILSDTEKQMILDKKIPLSQRKMLLLFTGERDIKVANVDIPSKRYIQDADISYTLEHQLEWLHLSKHPFREPTTVQEKTDFLKNLVDLHYKMVTRKLKEFNKEKFLIHLFYRYEALLQSRAFRHINYPAKILCYSQFYNVQEEFSQSEADLVETSLAIRVLIEFVVLQTESGEDFISDDDVDILLAQTKQLINYASLSDSIKYQIEDARIYELPSGRIGFKTDSREKIDQLREEAYSEEFYSYTEEFHKFFKRRQKEEIRRPEQELYIEKLNAVFVEEWGITLGEIDLICFIVSTTLFSENVSVKLISERDFINKTIELTNLSVDKIHSFLNIMEFPERPDPLTPPQGYEKWEVYPWRYNRRLSIILRPIIPIEKNGQKHFLLSARHLLVAAENLMSMFFKATLRVKKENKKIKQLLAERNKIKGQEYRDEVFEWLKQNTSLYVYPDEVKIKPKGFFKSDLDKGDIDILALDKVNNLVYSIECKNTVQSKLTYEYKMEFDNYLGTDEKEGLISKHVKRHNWLQENINQVQEKLFLQTKPLIKSIVISNNVLPLKHFKPVDMPIIAFYELRSRQFVF